MKTRIKFFLLAHLYVFSCSGNTKLDGKWEIMEGLLYQNPGVFGVIKNAGWVEFSGDTVISTLGFFHYTVMEGEDLPNDKFPFVYCGDIGKFTLKDDSLFMVIKRTGKRFSFGVQINGPNAMDLTSNQFGKVSLVRSRSKVNRKEGTETCMISAVRAKVLSVNYPTLHYEVTLTRDDSLFYKTDSARVERYSLPTGYFKEICSRLKDAYSEGIRPVYTSRESLFNSVELVLYLSSGNIVSTEMQNGNGPASLRLACIPVIYSSHLVRGNADSYIPRE